MARRLVDFAGLFVGWIRGGLALVNILASNAVWRDLWIIGC
ncbi:Uncharacterised protein [Kluyvera cryocrescens]|uniref:TRAP C4-dicarboxylate transport system permease DctM subunit domain-containing protein n=1 Tax=Kluyvera cryocrescens TaxID=580 RepID=A0A485ATW1_KLUCR|nr:Uncharacterised protein [Kluyvera cryocrescens]